MCCVRVCLPVCMALLHVCNTVYASICLTVRGMYIQCARARACVRVYVCVCVRACVLACLRACVRACVCVCLCTGM